MKTIIWGFVITYWLSMPIFAQWSNDPNLNTPVSLAGGEQAIPKVATSQSGTSYISWFSNETGNYNVMLQKMDVFGNKLWTGEGLLVSDHPAMSWLTEWDMTMDKEEHAILTFQDIRTGNNNIFAYRISPTGDFVWGEDGLQLSNSATAFNVSPKVTVTDSNNAVFAWQADNVVIIQKISPDGNKLWGENGITLSGSNTYSWPQLISVGEDEVILKYFEDSGPPNAPTRHVFAQRFDADGNPVWAQPSIISDAGGITAWTQVFPFINDGSDGFFIAWHDFRTNPTKASIYVQHIGWDGTVLFADDGIEASLMPNRNHLSAHLALPPGSQDIYVFWNEMDSDQNNRGIYGQKISSSGERLWTNNGKMFIEISPTDVFPFAARQSDADMTVFYEYNPSAANATIHAMRIDTDGNFVWEEETTDICSWASAKVHSVAGSYQNGQWILTWEDDRSGNKDIYGQNIQLDGTLGPIIYTENIVLEPDSVYCPPSWEAEQVFVINEGLLPVNILNMPLENYLTGWGWSIDNVSPNFPITIMPGDSLELLVQILIVKGKLNIAEWLCDWVEIEADSNSYWLEICVNEDLIEKIDQNKSTQIECFPNPAMDKVRFEFPSNIAENSRIIIYNSLGTIIKSIEIQQNNWIEWNCTDSHDQMVKPGTYYYEFLSGEYHQTGKIILME